jgi:2-oxoglutarate dehydrogenase E1 component
MERPLIVLTPKSLLRLPAAASTVDDLTSGGFHPVIDDAEVSDPSVIERVVLCSGKVYYDAAEARRKSGITNVSIVRLEQFYPFPLTRLREILNRYSNSKQLVWLQEEPKNMGGWTFMEERLVRLVPQGERPIYVGRSASASPATGSYAIHQLEQAKLVHEALTLA